MNRTTALFPIALAAFTYCAQASAADNEGTFRLSLQGVLYQSRSLTLELDDDNAPDAASVDVKDETSGLLSSNLGFSLAYGLSENLAIGTSILYGTSTQSVDLPGMDETSASAYQVIPFLEAGFLSGSVRPFLSGGLGLWGGQTSSGDEEVGNWSGYALGGSAGVQLFAADSFSIDPALSAYMVRGSYDLLDTTYKQSGASVFVSVALTGWLGGSRTVADAGDDPDAGEATGSGAALSHDAQAPAPRESRGIVTTSLQVGPNATVSFIARPERTREQVEMQVRFATTTPALEGCREVAMTSKDGEVLAGDLMYGSESTWEALRGTISTQALGGFAEARGVVSVRACGERWDLGPRDVQSLYSFYSRLAHERSPEQLEARGVRDDRGDLRSTIELNHKEKLILLGMPRKAQGKVTLRFHSTTNAPALASCSDVVLRAGDQVVPVEGVRYGATHQGTFTIEALVGHVGAEPLKGVGQGRKGHLEVCGRRLELGMSGLQTLLTFADEFMRRTPPAVAAPGAEGSGPQGVEGETGEP